MHPDLSPPIDQDRDFRRYYERHLQPLEEQFERLRRQAVMDRNTRLAAVILVWPAALSGYLYLAWPVGDYLFFVGLVALLMALGLGFWAWMPALAHQQRLKDQILTRIVPFFGGLAFKAETNYSPQRFKAWEILPDFTRHRAEDEIRGSYRGVDLRLAEIRLMRETSRGSGSNRSSSTETVFKGLLMEFALQQPQPGVVLVRSQGSDMRGHLRLNARLQPVSEGEGMEALAHSDQPTDWVTRDHLLGNLARIREGFGGGALFASFHDERLVMLVEHGEDWFEMSVGQRTDFARDAQRIRDQLRHILGVVDLLGLAREDAAQVNPQTIRFPDLNPPRVRGVKTADDKAARYDPGGWGCLGTFIGFALASCAALWLMADWKTGNDAGPLLGSAALIGLLLAFGIYLLLRAVALGGLGNLVFSLLLLSGAGLMVYINAPEPVQQQIQGRLQSALDRWQGNDE